MPLARIEDAIHDYRAGRFVIIVDDEDRENEGDLCFAAEKVTPEAINFMARHGRGLICNPVDGAGQHLVVRHRVHRFRRGAARRDHRYLRRRPRDDRPGHH
jgi:3,4-dihydroxy-2-butanone 4-phosphate synthase